MTKGTFTVTWKVDGSAAETHMDGENMPDQIKAMIADSLLSSLADGNALRVRVEVQAP